MTLTSAQSFRSHFCPERLLELIDVHLSPSVSRGVDGVNYERFLENKHEEVRLISSNALSGKYRFTPFRQKLMIKDANSAPRQVSIPTIRDRVALRALNNFLSEIFHDSRPQHSHPVISSAIKSIEIATKDDAFIKLDIQKFYDKINHDILQSTVKKRIRSIEPILIIMSAIRTPTGAPVSKGEVNHLGVPQGLSISNILASIYLKDIDRKYGSMLGIKYHRYVDDILCIAPSSESQNFADLISKDLKRRRKLNVHPIGSGKSSIIPIDERIEYLGYAFSDKGISVRKSTEKKLLSSLMALIHSMTKENLSRTFWRLNLRISGCRLNGSNVGWMFYFSQIDDIELLSKIDAQIKRAIVKKVGAPEYHKCKRFIKAYHEVKFNFRDSNYFHNFDQYERSEMITLLKRLFPERFDNIESKNDVEVRRIFNRVVTKEVRKMEHDTLRGFS